MLRTTRRAAISLPRVEPLRFSREREQRKSAAAAGSTPSFKRSPNFERAGAAASFAVKSRLHHFEKGLDPSNIRFAAEAEEQYRISSELVHRRPSGGTGATAETRRVLDVNEETGETEEVEVQRVVAPFGETYVPSSKEAYAFREKVGELTAPRSEAWMQPDGHRDRSMQFEAEARRILLEGGASLGDKAEVCVAMMIAARQQRILLQPATVEMAMQIWLQAADEVGSSSSSSGGNAGLRFLSPMRDAYMYLRSTLAAPTAFMIEALMLMLARSDAPNKKDVFFAHALLLDCDRYVTVASRTTYAAYFDVCNKNERMHFAVARYVDAVERLHIEVDTGMVQSLLRGLNQNGLVEEAVAFLSRIKEVQIDVQLLNTVLETLLMSSDARACFSAYDSACAAPILPNAETFTLVLLASDRVSDWSRVRSVLATMQRRRIKGTPTLLNLLLKGLLKSGLEGYAHQLYQTMVAERVAVWPALDDAMPGRIKAAQSEARRDGRGLRSRRGEGLVLSKSTVVRHVDANEQRVVSDTMGNDDVSPDSSTKRLITPKNEQHLRAIATRKPRLLMRVSLPYLTTFLQSRGIVVPSGKEKNRRYLLQRTHKALFGVRPQL